MALAVRSIWRSCAYVTSAYFLRSAALLQSQPTCRLVRRNTLTHGWAGLGGYRHLEYERGIVAFVTMAIAVSARTAFSLLLPPLIDEFGWDRGFVAGAFSFGLLVSAALSYGFAFLLSIRC